MPEYSVVPRSQVPAGKSTSHHRWTEEEKELIRQQYGQVPTARLAQQLGIKPRYVNYLARRLGLSGQGGPAFRHCWTDEDRQLVRKWYGKVPTEKLAQHFGVTKNAVGNQASKLGFTTPHRAKPHQWTEEEDEVLRREYQQTHESRDHLAYKLGVSPAQIARRCANLGLLKVTDRNLWTPAEERRLADLIEQGKNLQTIARLMKRSVNSVNIRSHRHLHLSLHDRNGWYTKKEVCEILGVEHKWLQRRIDSGALKASWHHGRQPGQPGMAAWHIAESALIDFIRTYPQDLNGRNVDLVAVVDLLASIQTHPLEQMTDQSIIHYRAQGWTYRRIAQYFGRHPTTVSLRIKKLKAREQADRERRRPAFCSRGHELTGDNLYIEPGSKARHCRACLWIKEQRRQTRKQQKQREAVHASVAD